MQVFSLKLLFEMLKMNKVNIIIFFYQSFQNISFTKFCLHYILCSIDFQVYQNKEKDPRKKSLAHKKEM